MIYSLFYKLNNSYLNTSLHKKLVYIHFLSLIIIILNYLLKHFTNYSLNGNIISGIKIFLGLSGLWLFFKYRKPFKTLSYYFLVYPLLPLILVTGFIIRGLLGALLISFVLFLYTEEKRVFSSKDYIIVSPKRGILANCCYYKLQERKGFLLVKNYEPFASDGPIDFSTLLFCSTDNEIKMIYYLRFKDTGIREITFSK